LLAQGAVNDLLRLVQQARKDAGLNVSDRIALTLEVPDELWSAVQARLDQVQAETLATSVFRGVTGPDAPGVAGGSVGAGVSARVAVALAR
jgi:isoleucyl-tRNA synthetase